MEKKEILLYDFGKTIEENFSNDQYEKYILLCVHKTEGLYLERNLPNPSSKVVVDFDLFQEYGFTENHIPIDYDSHFGLRLLAFEEYNSSFMNCDERVFFEALLIKYRSFDFKPFYWSKTVIFQEIGIKKDRANKIVKRFKELGIISAQIKKTTISGNPRQITYYKINCLTVIKLIPKLFIDRFDEVNVWLSDYLKPGINIEKSKIPISQNNPSNMRN